LQIGKFDFNSKWKHNFTAHPKIDPLTGEMIIFGSSEDVFKPGFYYGVCDKQGNVTTDLFVKLEFSTFLHDFAITKNYSVFMVNPLVFDMDGIWEGKTGFKFEREKGSSFLLIPRHCKDTKDIIELKTKGFFAFHTMNAFEESTNEIKFSACKYMEGNPLSFELKESEVDSKIKIDLCEWTLNLKTKEVTEETLISDINVEFPIISQSLVGQKNQFSYFLKGEGFGIVKYNSKSKKTKVFDYEKGFFGGEPFFVPRQNGKSEDDGYLMNFVWDSKTGKSFFFVIDAFNLKLVSKITLPRRVPSGFHGTWIQKE
jgi:carotenoid cleavage dioxygenase-like enzyme